MQNYQNFGVMLDCSRNAVMKPTEVMHFIDYLTKMGYNTLELYTEDTLKIDNEEYLGYMRGGYTKEEIKQIDAYAIKHGVELIPCIQTLGHFTNPQKLAHYQDIFDINDVLLIDEPKTYQFIENLIKTVSSCYTSKKINIGMDEAHFVGLGNYLKRNGYCDRYKLLLRHLNKVNDICIKYGLTPHMWSDMFFRLSGGDYYDADIIINEEVTSKVPKGVELTYWDYYHADEKTYDRMIDSHQKFEVPVWFAGGAWTWYDYIPANAFSLKTMRPAMKMIQKYDIKKVLITMWGDDGKNCSFFSVLPAIYSIRQYADGNFDEQKIKDGFKNALGFDYDKFMLLDAPTSCKHLLFNDCFYGFKDKNALRYKDVNYLQLSKDIKNAGKNMRELEYLFDSISALCYALDIKRDLSLKTRNLYSAKNIEGLKELLKDYDECAKRVEDFYYAFRKLWLKENKPFGLEVQEIRLGGLIARIKSCKDRLNEYILGKADCIPELDEKQLDIFEDFATIDSTHYFKIISASNLT